MDPDAVGERLHRIYSNIYIYSDVHTIRTSGLESFYYMNYIAPDNYNIQNILYIHRIFQNARR